ncbi:MAG TPA: helix-turn-helix transcriptional regulator [Mycobacterium sp.]|nr:helix-turn-helix transcriptional regulator [Mycobacterium sp.]
MNVAANLKRALAAKRMRQSELADQLGVSRPTVHAWVHGKAKPRLKMFDRLAQVLGTSKAALIR